jgi:hypothetical protein
MSNLNDKRYLTIKLYFPSVGKLGSKQSTAGQIKLIMPLG